MPSLITAGSALMSAGFNLVTGEGIGGGGAGRLGRISEDAAGGGGVARAAGAAEGAGAQAEAAGVRVGVVGIFVDFAHGTTPASANNIVNNGLNREASLGAMVASQRPGSFFRCASKSG